MFVCELDRPWSETNFAFQGFPLLTPDEMRAVRECCLYVYVDDTRRVRLQHGAPAAVAPRERKTPQRPQQPLASEIEEARAAYRDGSELIEQVLADVQHGRVIDTRACHGVVKRNLASMLRNESAMLWLIRLKSKDLYTSLHCLSVSIMAMGFGNHLGLADDKLQLLGMAGLLHDVGKMRIDPEILNKPGKLTAEEFDLIKRHPAFGLEALQAQPGIPQAALQAAYGHHERLRWHWLSAWLRAVADCLHDANHHHRRCVRCHHQSSRLRLRATGAVGVRDPAQRQWPAIRRGAGARIHPLARRLPGRHAGRTAHRRSGGGGRKHEQLQLRPRVVVLRDAAKQRCTPRYLDLARITVDEEGTPYRICGGLPDGSFGLHIADPELQSILHPQAWPTSNWTPEPWHPTACAAVSGRKA